MMFKSALNFYDYELLVNVNKLIIYIYNYLFQIFIQKFLITNLVKGDVLSYRYIFLQHYAYIISHI